MRTRRGFSLVEMASVVAIIALLAAIAVNEFYAAVMRAKRVEAWEGLTALDAAQQYFYMQHGIFADTFDKLDFKVEGGTQLSGTTYQGDRYVYELSQPYGSDTYYATATAALDSDPWPDVLEIYDM
jgi:prepilin-type N-terminal cleavage/methylation domain-containing protein